MKLKNKRLWKKYQETNKEISAIAEKWANKMEEQLPDSIRDIAESSLTEILRDKTCIFSPDLVVGILNRVWEYGEQLKQWHNQQFLENGHAFQEQKA